MTFERRRIIIESMAEEDVELYYMQFDITEEERKKKIAEIRKCIRACKNSESDPMLFFIAKLKGNRGILGSILIKKIDSNKISLQISIPKESNESLYGVEVVDQFIKICKEETFFKDVKYVKLDRENETMQRYMEGKGIRSNYIYVA